MQDSLTLSHRNLNDMFKRLTNRHIEVEKHYDKYDKELKSIEIVNKNLDKRG